MRRLGPLLLVFALACSEGGAASPEPSGPTSPPVDPSETTTPPPPRVSIGPESVELDGREVARLRPADQPGVLDAELRPTYVDARLREAFAATSPVRLDLAAAPRVGAVRMVLASHPEGRIELELAEGRTITTLLAPRGDAAWLRVGEGYVELRRPGAPATRVDELADVSQLLGGGGGDERLAVELDDRRPASELFQIAEAAAAAGVRELVLALDYAPCLAPPEGMACIPGGFAIVGSDEDGANERPRREVELSTYYLDVHEITIADYDACRAARACPRRLNGGQNIMKPFVGAEQPVVPMDWERAVRYCAWAGKRLPSEWEWEKGARGPDGDVYPWGNDAPSCERAQYRECAPWGCTPYPGKANRWDCNEHATKPVGSYPAGHYGLHEMAGNGYEWTATAGFAELAECGEACSGRDPRGPCDGATPCGNTRVLRGGSWYWPADQIRGSYRRVEARRTGGHRLSARCATDQPFLTRFPSAAIDHPRAAPPAPAPPGAEQLAKAQAITQDPIEDKHICTAEFRESWGVQWRGGRSAPTCRDPYPYLESNEARLWLWAPYLTHLGGGYLGVGSDQNYSFIALARSEWAWVMDYDPRVTDHHRRLRAFVLASATPEEFIALWSSARTDEAFAAIAEHEPGADAAKLRRGYLATRERLHEYYRDQADHPGAEGFGWLAVAEHYAYVRAMFQQGRIELIKGDLLGKDSMRTVGDAARSLGTPIRVFYTSNAPISWGGELTPQYRANVLGLPFDRRSIVLQTTAKGGFRQSGHWHYNVQWGRHLQDRLRRAGYRRVDDLLFERIPGGHGDLTLIGLPSGVAD